MRLQGRDLRAGLSGQDVAELHQMLARLGSQIPDNERTGQLFGEGTTKAVVAFQARQRLPETGVVEEKTAAALTQAIASLPIRGVAAVPVILAADALGAKVAVAEPGLRRLNGRLYSDRGAPAAEAKLRIYERGFGGKGRMLAEAITGHDGTFAVDGSLPEFRTSLEVRLVTANGEEVSLAGPRQRITVAEPVDLVAPSDRLASPALEYARLTADMRPLLGGRRLAEAREDDDQNDLTLLHEATGWDARLIALGACAEKLAAATGLDPQAAYGMLRAGLPTDPVQLARVTTVGIGHALSKAAHSGVIALNADQIAAAQASMEAFGKATRRKLAMAGTASSYGSMLTASGLDRADQDRFDEIFSAHTGDAAELWQRARAAGLPADQLKLTAQLGALTLNSARLVEDLRTRAHTTDRLADSLVADKLYQPAGWEARLRSLAGGNDRVLAQMIPPLYQGETVEHRVHAYAADLAYKVRRSFPMQVVSDRIRNGELTAAADSIVAHDVATVLDRAAAAGFALGQQPLHRFVAQRQEQLFAGIPAGRSGAAVEALKTLYRRYQITASDEGMVALQRAGLNSAYAVSALPEKVFLARHGQEFPSLAEASLTWHRAQQITAVALSVVTAAKQLGSLQLLPALTYPGDLVGPAQEDLVRQFPTLESLFGSLDFCECDHCRSVLSPAAYLVDLLKFLDDAPATPKTPYQALTARRPDLPHLKLTCENTNTALPYIDVVNEILEFYLTHGGDLGPAAAFDTGDAASEDLIAEPQNLLPAAYNVLKQARYPIGAPFDLWLATARAFTEHFGSPFWQVLEALRTTDDPHPPGDGYGTAAVAYERLGFGPGEVAILTEESPIQTWPALYGYPGGAGPAVWGELANAKVLARRLGLTYHELVAILRTSFVNPGFQLVLADAAEEDCSWENTTLRHQDGQAATPMDFVLLNYFVRVWRRLGRPIADTDQAVVTFLPAFPDPRSANGIGPGMTAVLLGMSQLNSLAELAEAGHSERRHLPVLWAPLAERHYVELFLTGTTQTRDPAFDGQTGTYLTTGGVLLQDHREAVQAALRLTADDIFRILTAAGLEPATAQLTMANVSLLYRHGLLAQLLKLSIADLLAVKELSGLDPFGPAPESPLRFAQLVREITAGGLSIADLEYLIRHRFDEVGEYRAAALPPLSVMQTLTREITRIRAEYAVPANALIFTDEVIARTLALVLDAAVAVAFVQAWTGAAPLPPGLFEEQLRRQVIPGVGEVGFLGDADVEPLFSPVAGDQAADAARRELLAGLLLPYVQQRLIRQAVAEVVAADQNADAAMVETLLTSPALLDDPQEPGRALLDGYVAAAGHGLSTVDGVQTGFLEVPASGGYQISARCAAEGTAVLLRFDHLAEPVLVATSTATELAPAAQVELKGGVAYGFTLEHTAGAAVQLWVRGQRVPGTPMEKLKTYPRSGVDRVHQLHLLLGKALRVASKLPLNEIELRHVLTHAGDFGGLDLGALPTGAGQVTPEQVQAHFMALHRLIAYVQLRGELAADPADLIGVFARARRRAGDNPAQAAEETLAAVCAAVGAITRREPDTVREAADLLGMSAAVAGNEVVATGFTSEAGLSRLWRVLSMADRLGVSPATLGGWATPEPDHQVAHGIRDTVRAIYPAPQWRRVAQPIFDKLRRQRRDALVARVLQLTGYERAEQLFEHFLIDPGTEPVVLTSRLRLAISSVQTFVQRCLLNLEADVAPSAINAAYWEWMKRYRVWEANRKIFLWPENWLEPELRDDKTHLFTELEGALLDSDLDNQAVEGAMLRYLSGLEEIARLDIRAIYRETKPTSGGDVVHVLARTTTAPHRYFYRTWSRRTWTPWVPVTTNIEGNHASIVMWQGRLHIFWVAFADAQATATTAGLDEKTKASQLTMGELTQLKPQQQMAIKLYWSCLSQGEWSQPVLANPDPLVRPVGHDFKPGDQFVWAHVYSNGQAAIGLVDGIGKEFRVSSRHAPPTVFPASEPIDPPYLSGDEPVMPAGQGRWLAGKRNLSVHVEGETITEDGSTPCDVTEAILKYTPETYRLILVPPPVVVSETKPKLNPPNRADDPFFYLDSEHTFFVEPAWAEFSIPQADQGVVAQSPVWHDFDDPQFWAGHDITPAFPVLNGQPLLAVVDGITTPEFVVNFSGKLIGPTGRITEPVRVHRKGPHGALARTVRPARS